MKPILIFDSGVGGLTVYQEVRHLLPSHNYVFASDNDAFPYGLKSDDFLTQRVVEVMGRLIDHYDPELVVIACNTASTIVLPLLRDRFDVDFVGVVPAIKPAAKHSKTKHLAVLATPATVARDYTQNLIDQYAEGCQVTLVASSRLVSIAEQKMMGESVSQAQIQAELTPLFELNKLDTLVLA
ncbi:MAG: glutamate racemase, partial [Pseudomonadota bacterium]